MVVASAQSCALRLLPDSARSQIAQDCAPSPTPRDSSKCDVLESLGVGDGAQLAQFLVTETPSRVSATRNCTNCAPSPTPRDSSKCDVLESLGVGDGAQLAQFLVTETPSRVSATRNALATPRLCTQSHPISCSLGNKKWCTICAIESLVVSASAFLSHKKDSFPTPPQKLHKLCTIPHRHKLSSRPPT